MPPIEKTEKLDFQVILHQDGNIGFRFLVGQQERFSAICEPQQIGHFIAPLLEAMHASGRLVGTSTQLPPGAPVRLPPAQVLPLERAIPVSNWYFGDTNIQGQKAVIVEIGKAKIGFVVSQDQMRGLGRAMVGASWKTGASTAYLVPILGEFGRDLIEWIGIKLNRVALELRKRRNLTLDWIRGRSFRSFCVRSIGADLPVPGYAAIKTCIYCGDPIYSHDPSIRKHPLGAEHIVAEGLGGTLELPEASCQACEHATGAIGSGPLEWCNRAEQAASERALNSAVASERLAVGHR
jgi:hypothetical protein